MAAAPTVRARYETDGFVSGVRVVPAAEAAQHRERLEAAERRLGPLHYCDKVHTVMASAFELASHPALLDAVEACIGPDILLYNSTYIIKEPASPAQVAWHQDLTYWGLADADAQVSAWIALEPATEESGCMRMLPGSHRAGPLRHETGSGNGNLLLLGQHVSGVDEGNARLCELAPGEASLHHGWTLHTSAPNRAQHRRIGLNIQYLAPSNRFIGASRQSAMLLRGEDQHHHFASDHEPSMDLDPAALARWPELDDRMKQGFKNPVRPAST